MSAEKKCLFLCNVEGCCKLFSYNECQEQCRKIFEDIINLAMLEYPTAKEIIGKVADGYYFPDEAQAQAEYEIMRIVHEMTEEAHKQGNRWIILQLPKMRIALSAQDFIKALTESGYLIKGISQGKASMRADRVQRYENNKYLKKSS